jgi:hypothetical protein
MIADFFMLLLASAIGTLIIGLGFYWVAEKTHNSKLALMFFIAGVIILTYGSVHEHNCKKDYIAECSQAHELNLTYNYCQQKVLYPNDNFASDAMCYFHPARDCKTMQDGCVNYQHKNIDGFCLPFTPICLLFNKPQVVSINFTYVKEVINWTARAEAQKEQEKNKTMVYWNETYQRPVYNFTTRYYDMVNFTVVKNKTV